MVNSLAAAASVSTPTTLGTPSSTLGKDAFLKLLVQQLQHQDPLNPMQGTEFASQLAQFSSVEQLSNINTQLKQSLNANSALTSSINNALATTFIGKGVRAATDTFVYDGKSAVKIGYTLGQSANATNVKIYDANGNLVRTLKNTGSNPGDTTVTWDGKDDNGNVVATGKMKFVVESTDDKGQTVQVQQFLVGTVTGVRFRSDGTVFIIDGVEVPLSQVLEIMEG